MSEKQVAVVSAVLSFSKMADDERFAPCVIKIAHAGLNQNKSVISKEVFEANARSAYGCPIVCNYDIGADYIGGHDKAIIRRDDGAQLINMTHPVGYVPDGSKYWWETIVEDGEEKEYLCMNALLWKRESAYRHIEECGRIAQSMEISIKINDFVKDGDFFIVNAFTFVAFCLLEREEPAMRSACIELFSRSDFMEQFSFMMDEFHQDYEERRKETPLETTTKETNAAPEGAVDETVQAAESEVQTFSLDASALQCELSKCISAFEMHPNYPDWPRFGVIDFDPATQEVFAFDHVDHCICGFRYTTSGDDVAVSRDSYAKKKSKYVEWEHGSDTGVNVVQMFTESREQLFALEAKNQELSASVEQLTAYRIANETAERERALQALRTEFSDIADEAAFQELFMQHGDLPIDTLTEKAFALRGRMGSKPVETFSAAGNGPQGLHIDSHAAGGSAESHPYGSAAKYFPKKD